VLHSKCLSFANQELKKFASVLGLVENSGALKLEEVLHYHVTNGSLSIFIVHGTVHKVQ
jgi:hypothetical protein